MSLTYEKLFSVLQKVGFSFSSIEEMKTMKGYLISRNCLLYKDNYDEIADLFPRLKQMVDVNQKYPLLNLLQKILNVYNFNFKPICKFSGYDENGDKKYDRYFFVNRRV